MGRIRDRDDLRHWTYLINGPFTSLGEYQLWVSRAVLTTDPLFYAVIQAGRAVGVARTPDRARGRIH